MSICFILHVLVDSILNCGPIDYLKLIGSSLRTIEGQSNKHSNHIPVQDRAKDINKLDHRTDNRNYSNGGLDSVPRGMVSVELAIAPESLAVGVEFFGSISTLVAPTRWGKWTAAHTIPRFQDTAWYNDSVVIFRGFLGTVTRPIYIVRKVLRIVVAQLCRRFVPSLSYLYYESYETVNMLDEKHQDEIAPVQSSTESVNTGKVDIENDGEIFKRGEGIEDFRTVHWIHTSVIFLKRK